MNVKDALKMAIDSADMIASGYVKDLTDQELLHRPAKGCNHINWQLGHIITGENYFGDKAVAGIMPPLPADFAAKYTKETATSDDPQAFCTKAELMKLWAEQRAGTLAALAKVNEADFDKATGIEYAPTVAALFNLAATHWLMHAGQWAVIRRQLGRPPQF